jgi:hypothetical protein
MVRTFYLLAAILGFIVPYVFFFQFLVEHGLNLSLFFQQMFATPIAAFFSADVIVSSLAFWAFLYSEGRRFAMRNLWIYVLLNLLVGVSFALPVFLFVRENKKDGQFA